VTEYRIYCPELDREFPVWLTPAQVGELREISEQAVWRLCRLGRIPGVIREGARYRISAAATLTEAGLSVARHPSAGAG
jgi:predicted site-specific integrase-resolvase